MFVLLINNFREDFSQCSCEGEGDGDTGGNGRVADHREEKHDPNQLVDRADEGGEEAYTGEEKPEGDF